MSWAKRSVAPTRRLLVPGVRGSTPVGCEQCIHAMPCFSFSPRLRAVRTHDACQYVRHVRCVACITRIILLLLLCLYLRDCSHDVHTHASHVPVHKRTQSTPEPLTPLSRPLTPLTPCPCRYVSALGTLLSVLNVGHALENVAWVGTSMGGLLGMMLAAQVRALSLPCSLKETWPVASECRVQQCTAQISDSIELWDTA